MIGYLGTFSSGTFLSSSGYRPPDGAGKNFGILSSSPYVREDWLSLQESFYAEMEKKGRKPNKVTGRYKHVASVIQSQLEGILSNPESFQKLKELIGGFNKVMIGMMFVNTPILDERDPENPFEDSWMVSAGGLAYDAEKVIEWVRQNADGPLSVI